MLPAVGWFQLTLCYVNFIAFVSGGWWVNDMAVMLCAKAAAICFERSRAAEGDTEGTEGLCGR